MMAIVRHLAHAPAHPFSAASSFGWLGSVLLPPTPPHPTPPPARVRDDSTRLPAYEGEVLWRLLGVPVAVSLYLVWDAPLAEQKVR
jgi:hypothetical protein